MCRPSRLGSARFDDSLCPRATTARLHCSAPAKERETERRRWASGRPGDGEVDATLRGRTSGEQKNVAQYERDGRKACTARATGELSRDGRSGCDRWGWAGANPADLVDMDRAPATGVELGMDRPRRRHRCCFGCAGESGRCDAMGWKRMDASESERASWCLGKPVRRPACSIGNFAVVPTPPFLCDDEPAIATGWYLGNK